MEEEDKYLLEINVHDLATNSGETQTYWLLVICVARDARVLQENETNNNAAGIPYDRRKKYLNLNKNIACHDQNLTAFNRCYNPGAILLGE